MAVDAKWRPTAAEGVKRDEAVMGKTAELFAKLGLSTEQADALVKYSDELGKLGGEAQEKAIEAALKERHAGWWKNLQESKELGGAKFEENRATWMMAAKSLLTADELKQVEADGLANYPPLIHALYRAGAKISEDTLQDGNRAAPPVPDALAKAKIQYPKSPELWDPTHPEFQGAKR